MVPFPRGLLRGDISFEEAGTLIQLCCNSMGCAVLSPCQISWRRMRFSRKWGFCPTQSSFIRNTNSQLAHDSSLPENYRRLRSSGKESVLAAC